MTEQRKTKKERITEEPASPPGQEEVKDEGAASTDSMVYIGPDLELVPQFSVFRNGIPEHLRAEILAKAILGELLVPVKELPAAQEALRTPGTKQYLLYKEAQKQVGSEI